MVKRLFKQFKYGKRGFTLIELLVVVAILGILAAVAIPNVAKFMNSGKTQASDTEVANVQTAVTAFMADNNGSTPADMAALQAYLMSTPKNGYSWDSNGRVSITSSGF